MFMKKIVGGKIVIVVTKFHSYYQLSSFFNLGTLPGDAPSHLFEQEALKAYTGLPF